MRLFKKNRAWHTKRTTRPLPAAKAGRTKRRGGHAREAQRGRGTRSSAACKHTPRALNAQEPRRSEQQQAAAAELRARRRETEDERREKTTRGPAQETQRGGGPRRSAACEQTTSRGGGSGRRGARLTPGVERPTAPPSKPPPLLCVRNCTRHSRDEPRRAEFAARAAEIRAAGVRVVHVRVHPARGRLGGGGATLSAISTTHYVSIWGKKSTKSCAPARDTAKTSRDEPSLLLARSKSEPPACESSTCACVPRGGDWEAEELRLVRFQPLSSCRFGAKHDQIVHTCRSSACAERREDRRARRLEDERAGEVAVAGLLRGEGG
jgi:hypothetical protein